MEHVCVCQSAKFGVWKPNAGLQQGCLVTKCAAALMLTFLSHTPVGARSSANCAEVTIVIVGMVRFKCVVPNKGAQECCCWARVLDKVGSSISSSQFLQKRVQDILNISRAASFSAKIQPCPCQLASPNDELTCSHVLSGYKAEPVVGCEFLGNMARAMPCFSG